MSKAAELAALIGSQSALSNRNLIINGAFQVAQRGTSATVSDNSNEGYSTLDRWFVNFNNSVGGGVTFSQSTDTPSGFANSLKIQCSNADSVGSTNEYVGVRQLIEAQNLQMLGYGTSAAKSMTLSWQMKADNYTGPISVQFKTADGTAEYYVKSYTPTSSWATYTCTVPGSTSATINDDNGEGMRVQFTLAGHTGSSIAASSDSTAWSTTRADYRDNIGNLLSNTSNAIYITGVQLELGEQATPFEHRSFGDELARCQRYFQDYTTDRFRHQQGYAESGTAYARDVLIPQMRANPTVTVSDENRNGFDAISAAGNAPHRVDFTANCTVTGTSRFYDFKFTADAEL